MTSRAPRPTAAPHTQPFVEFGSALQDLVADFWDSAETSGRVADAQGTVNLLEYVFGALAHELGRIDGVARLHGVGREQMLALLSKAYASGKQATLEHHHQDSQGCTCEASMLLKKELELH